MSDRTSRGAPGDAGQRSCVWVGTLDAAITLARARFHTIWAIEAQDVDLAHSLISRFPSIGARDMLHLACCMRHGADELKTFDRALDAAFRS